MERGLYVNGANIYYFKAIDSDKKNISIKFREYSKRFYIRKLETIWIKWICI